MNEIYCYDKNVQLIGVVDDYESFWFERSYSGIGEWSCVISGYSKNAQPLIDCAFISAGRGKSGLKTKVEISKGQSENKIVVSGKELKALTEKRIVLPDDGKAYVQYKHTQADVIMKNLIAKQLIFTSQNRKIDGKIAENALNLNWTLKKYITDTGEIHASSWRAVSDKVELNGAKYVAVTLPEQDVNGVPHFIYVGYWDVNGEFLGRVNYNKPQTQPVPEGAVYCMFDYGHAASRDVPISYELIEQAGQQFLYYSEPMDYSGRFSSLSEDLISIASTNELGWYADIEQNEIVWHIYKGEDRTINQNQRNRLILSYALDTVSGSNYSKVYNIANTALVAGQGEGVDREIIMLNDEAEGLERNEVYIDARDIEQGGNLEQRGNEKLAEYGTSTILEVLPAEGILLYNYGKGFDLGDVATVADIPENSRITAIKEIRENNAFSLNFVLGYDANTLSDAFKRLQGNNNALLNEVI